MKKKSLIETNPYLKDPKVYEAMLNVNVISSSAIEGVRLSRTAPGLKPLKKAVKADKH